MDPRDETFMAIVEKHARAIRAKIDAILGVLMTNNVIHISCSEESRAFDASRTGGNWSPEPY